MNVKNSEKDNTITLTSVTREIYAREKRRRELLRDIEECREAIRIAERVIAEAERELREEARRRVSLRPNA